MKKLILLLVISTMFACTKSEPEKPEVKEVILVDPNIYMLPDRDWAVSPPSAQEVKTLQPKR